MGVAGSRWTHHHKVKGLFVGAQRYGLPPHPDVARTGQRYTPRVGDKKIPFTVTSGQKSDGTVGIVLFTTGERRTMDAYRLLATDENGFGKNFVYHGFISTDADSHVHDFGSKRNDKRHDKTIGRIVSDIDDEGMVEVSLPEIHPKVSFLQHAHLIDPDFLELGTWLDVTVDLGTYNPGRLRGTFNVVGLAGPQSIARGEYFMGGGVANRPDRPPAAPVTKVVRGMKFRPRAITKNRPGGNTLYAWGEAGPDGKVVCSNTKRRSKVAEKVLLDPNKYAYLGITKRLPTIATKDVVAA